MLRTFGSTHAQRVLILSQSKWPEFASWWLLCFGFSITEKKMLWARYSQTSHDAADQSPRPCFCMAAVWPGNLEMLYQHPHHHSLTPISVNTLTAEADSHTSTPPVPFSSISLHISTSPRAYEIFEEGRQGWLGGRKAKDNYGSAFVFTSGNHSSLVKIDCQSCLPGGT